MLTVLFLGCKKIGDTTLSGQRMISLELMKSDSSFVKTDTLALGKALALFFFDPYCPHCRLQLKGFLAAPEIFQDRIVCMIAVTSISSIAVFEEEFGLDTASRFMVARDTSLRLMRHFRVDGIPYTVLYDKKHRLLRTFNFRINTAILKKYW